MSINSHYEYDIYGYLHYSQEILDKYIIKYDCDKMPPDYANYVQLDMQSEKVIFEGKEFVKLNSYKRGVIIESVDENFEVIIGGQSFLIAKGKKHIPKFPRCHEFLIKIMPNLKIYYRDVDAMDFWDAMKLTFTNSILGNYDNVILDNLVSLDRNGDENKNINGMIIFTGSLMGQRLADKPILRIDENKFYHDYKEFHKNQEPKIIDEHIFIFDTLVQSGLIQICENNYKN